MKSILQVIFVLLATTLSLQVTAQTYVNANATGDNDGSSWINAYTDLQDALTNYNLGDEIWVVKGTYLPHAEMTIPLSGNRKKTFYINQDVKMFGGFAGNETSISERDFENNPTILSGDFNGDDVLDDFDNNRSDNAINVVYVESTVTTASLIDGFIIKGGHAAGDTLFTTDLRGGGVFSWGAIQVTNCIFQQNYADAYGGGLYYRDEQANGGRVMHCTFEKNACLFSGGGMIAAGQSIEGVQVDSCLFNYNIAGEGGSGLYSSSTKLKINSSNFVNNQSGILGALYIWTDANSTTAHLITNTIMDCTFDNNSGQIGAGFTSWVGSFDMKDCTFSNNQAMINDPSLNTLGGAIFVQFEINTDKRKVNIQNCNFVKNSSEQDFGAICIYDNCAVNESNEINIDNCFFQENSSSNVGGLGLIRLSNIATISNSIFDNNRGKVQAIGAGSLLPLSNGFDLLINNCLFTNHVASDEQDVIVGFSRFTSKLSNCTFADNQSVPIGVQDFGNSRLQNNIFQTTAYPSLVAINGTVPDFFTSRGGNMFADSTAKEIALDIDLQNVSALFETGTYQLSDESSCVDAGVLPDDPSEIDLAGKARVQGSCIDIGAYESVHDAGTDCAILSHTKEVLLDASTIRVYPNPASENTIIVFENEWEADLQIRIINMFGQIQSMRTIGNADTMSPVNLDISQLAKGTYKVLISDGKQMVIGSFVKM